MELSLLSTTIVSIRFVTDMPEPIVIGIAIAISFPISAFEERHSSNVSGITVLSVRFYRPDRERPKLCRWLPPAIAHAAATSTHNLF